ncbi:MAG: DUF192 domain-containing protein [Candidatus Curtissbacteria bacterium]|nr:DUF192 domain-containing protein [Candidatus Curtissbacteria bacterium]
MKKDLAIILGLFLLVVGLLVFGGSFSTSSLFRGQATSSASSQTQKKTTTVSIKGLNIEADIAKNADQRKKGLAGRDGLEISRGTLFVFDDSGSWAIWMKDMKFPIDIIWIDENKKVVYIVQSALPEPGKKDSQLTVYRPSGNSKYVLELNAGITNANNLQIGDSVNFEL